MGLFSFGSDIGVDLGTASVLIYVRGRGIVLNEPSVVAMDQREGHVIAIGEEARQMLGRTPDNIVAVRPLREGVIANYDITEKMLRYFIGKACGKNWLFRPRVMVCIPTGVTDVEERAVRQATVQSGARQAFLMEEPLAAALGAGLDIVHASGSMVVDIGGGTTDIAVLSLGGIVCSKSLRIGGDKFDEAIVRYMRRSNNMLIGERFAEDLKTNVATAFVPGLTENRLMEVRGRDLLTGLPKTMTFSSIESADALAEPIEAIVMAVREVLEITPPELTADIIQKGIMMTGGGALLHGLDQLLAYEIGIPVNIADDPIACVVRGTGKALSQLHSLNNPRGFSRQAL